MRPGPRSAICSVTDRARADDRRSTTLASQRQAASEVAQQTCARSSEPEGDPAATKVTNRIPASAAPGLVTIRRRPRYGRLPACVPVGIALLSAGLLAGCGGGAQRAGSPSKVMSGALSYANCMRSHGVPDVPDPNGQGEFQLHTIFENGRATQGEDLVPSSPAFQAAQRACGSFGSAGRQVTRAQEDQAFQQALKAAVCMRVNGVPNYPDPKVVDGSIDQEFNGRFSPDSPAFQQAARKCAKPGVVLSGTLPPG